jgi:ABC-type transporter Mla subunit MlaD
MIHSILCGILIVFFAWLLLHALIYSTSGVGEGRIIEGLESSSPDANDANAAQLAILKTQIASLNTASNQLNAMLLQNEAGIKNNSALIQKVMQSQNDTNAKLASMKTAQ